MESKNKKYVVLRIDREIRRLPLAQMDFYRDCKEGLPMLQVRVASFPPELYLAVLDPLCLNPKNMFSYLHVNQTVFLDS